MPGPNPRPGAYALTFHYSLPEDAWHVELDDLAAGRRMVVTAIVPDEDPAREPTLCWDPAVAGREIPYDVMRWFMEHVEEEIRTSRAWMALRPEIVEVIRALREEHLGVLADEEAAPVLAGLRGTVPEADLADVMHHAFGRGPDGRLPEEP
ncbi:hypothetical protein SLA_5422 [Streptomyces laurentii]|uniref:Uncharacterized protein n=1 Tax=Streptomyces laurentii TaxID=39478 RepID=A0A160P6E5_STRLU|nr:hypothetical protein SLA_5422 [Streptomyces laurentii]